MNAEEKAVEIGRLKKLCKVLNASVEERKQIFEGGSILLNLNWPSNYIFGKTICQRAIEGLVPRYEGVSSLADYEERWRSEDQK